MMSDSPTPTNDIFAGNQITTECSCIHTGPHLFALSIRRVSCLSSSGIWRKPVCVSDATCSNSERASRSRAQLLQTAGWAESGLRQKQSDITFNFHSEGLLPIKHAAQQGRSNSSTCRPDDLTRRYLGCDLSSLHCLLLLSKLHLALQQIGWYLPVVVFL